MHAFARESIEIDRKSCDESFTFTGLHLGDFALMEDNAADELNVEMAHVQHTPACFTGYSKSFRQDLIQDLFAGFDALRVVLNVFEPFADAVAELLGFGAKLLVRELFHLRFEFVNLVDERTNPFEFAFVRGAKYLGS